MVEGAAHAVDEGVPLKERWLFPGRRRGEPLTTRQLSGLFHGAAIERCRTAALGDYVARCEVCSHTTIAYNSCRNRHLYGRRPPCKRNLTFLRCDRVRSCMRPIGAASLAAGHDVIRGSGPNQGGALFPRVALGGFSRSNGSTVSHPSFSPLQFETLHLHSSIPYFFIAEPFIF